MCLDPCPAPRPLLPPASCCAGAQPDPPLRQRHPRQGAGAGGISAHPGQRRRTWRATDHFANRSFHWRSWPGVAGWHGGVLQAPLAIWDGALFGQAWMLCWPLPPTTAAAARLPAPCQPTLRLCLAPPLLVAQDYVRIDACVVAGDTAYVGEYKRVLKEEHLDDLAMKLSRIRWAGAPSGGCGEAVECSRVLALMQGPKRACPHRTMQGSGAARPVARPGCCAGGRGAHQAIPWRAGGGARVGGV